MVKQGQTFLVKSLKDMENIWNRLPSHMEQFQMFLTIKHKSIGKTRAIQEAHEKMPVVLDGTTCMIDEHCADLVKWFNDFGLKTKYCCQGNKDGGYYILFDSSVQDEDIDRLLLKFYDCYGIIQHHGNFEKWKRCFNGQVVTNWRYTGSSIEGAYADHEMFLEIFNSAK